MAKKSRKRNIEKPPAETVNTAPNISFSRDDIVWGLLLLVGVFIAYLPVWHAGFIWDDDAHLTANPCIVGPLGLKEIWTTNAADISPLTRSTFWLEHKLWGLAPLPYHLVNVLLHGACAIVLWRVLLALRIPGAWLGAAIWAFHSVNVESVAWITEMKNTESGLFYLLSIHFFLRWIGASKFGWHYGLMLIFSAAAMASKSSTVILPVILCLCAWWTTRRWNWRILIRIVPIFLFSILASASTLWTQKLQLDAYTETSWAQSWPARFVTAGDAIWFYLGKLIWPYPLMAIYPRWTIEAGNTISYLPLLAVAALLLVLWFKRDSWGRPCLFAFAYFIVALLPVLGFATQYFTRYSFVADHFQYLASMGPLALVGAGINGVSFRLFSEKSWLLAMPGTAVLMVLALLSYERAGVYESEQTLWTDTLAKNPQCWIGYNNLGKALFLSGEMEHAVADFQSALQIKPDYELAHNNLGLALAQEGHDDDALAEYEKAVAADPNYAEAHSNLAAACLDKGEIDRAITESQAAIKINPFLSEGHNNLAAAYFRKGAIDDAISELQSTIKINPNNASTYVSLGDAFLRAARSDDAVVSYETALRIDPKTVDAHNNLGWLLLKQGHYDEAQRHFQTALELNHGSATAHFYLGVLLYQQHDFSKATDEFRETLLLDPKIGSARKYLKEISAVPAK